MMIRTKWFVLYNYDWHIMNEFHFLYTQRKKNFFRCFSSFINVYVSKTIIIIIDQMKKKTRKKISKNFLFHFFWNHEMKKNLYFELICFFFLWIMDFGLSIMSLMSICECVCLKYNQVIEVFFLFFLMIWNDFGSFICVIETKQIIVVVVVWWMMFWCFINEWYTMINNYNFFLAYICETDMYILYIFHLYKINELAFTIFDKKKLDVCIFSLSQMIEEKKYSIIQKIYKW